MVALRAAQRMAVRPLHDRDLPALRALIAADPLVNAAFAARLDGAGALRPGVLGGKVVGVGLPGALRAACFLGGNVRPVGGDPGAWHELAGYLGGQRRACTAIVGAADALDVLWPALAAAWGPAREVRRRQPLLATWSQRCAPDPQVRAARPDDLDRYLPAAIAMFAEEVGTPLGVAAWADYRARVAGLLEAGRCLVRVDGDGVVEFKAEIAVVSSATCQVQGVWVRPDLRGRGIGTAAMCAVVAHGLRLAPAVSLYVNDFNLPARRLYARLGMRQVATLATVLF